MASINTQLHEDGTIEICFGGHRRFLKGRKLSVSQRQVLEEILPNHSAQIDRMLVTETLLSVFSSFESTPPPATQDFHFRPSKVSKARVFSDGSAQTNPNDDGPY